MIKLRFDDFKRHDYYQISQHDSDFYRFLRNTQAACDLLPERRILGASMRSYPNLGIEDFLILSGLSSTFTSLNLPSIHIRSGGLECSHTKTTEAYAEGSLTGD
jgi:hypothetical protein